MTNPAPDSITVWPRIPVLVAFAIATFVTAWVIGLLLDLDLVYPIATALGGSIGYAFSQRATFAPAGVGLGRYSSPWDTIAVHTGRWGPSLRSLPGVERRARIHIWLPGYIGRRRNEVIERVRVWAPHLDLEPATDT